MADGQLILTAGALLAAGLLASLLAVRLRVPSLVLFMGVGMAIGSDGTGWISFSDYELARTIGVIALALILFEGGLAAGLIEIRPVLLPAASLAILGTVVTAVITGVAASLLFDFTRLEGLLLGSIVAATDGAAIFALLRTSTLKRRLARTLEAESGFNDPVAVVLVLGFIEWIQNPGYDLGDFAVLFGRQLGIGLAVGALVGWAGVQAFRRIRLATLGLYPVASLAVASLAYGAAAALDGSGFLAVYLAGLALGTAAIPARQTVTAFHEGLAWVGQVTMFLALGLLVFPSQLGGVALEGTALALVLVFVARPLAVLVATSGAGYSVSERIVLGWAGLRGAVPMVLATFAVLAPIPKSLEFFNIVFFAVLFSTVLQGATFEPLARRLGATTGRPALPSTPIDVGTIQRLGADVLEFGVNEGDAVVGAPVRDLGLPREALVTTIIRGDQALAPRGATRIRAGDRLQVLARRESIGELTALTERWHRGPVGPPPRPGLAGRGMPPLFSVGPWTPADGDPSAPTVVAGQPVVERLRERLDRPGALCLLADGRFAISGAVLAVGSREAMDQWTRRRIRELDDEQEGTWLKGVLATLAADPGLPP